MSGLISRSAIAGRRLIPSIVAKLSSSSHPSSSKPSKHQATQMAVKDLVESAIDNNTVVVFSKTWCPYCKRAKALLTDSYPNAEVKVYELDEESEGSEIQNYLAQKTGQRTVPNVFIKKQHIGGCDDLFALHSRGGIKL